LPLAEADLRRKAVLWLDKKYSGRQFLHFMSFHEIGMTLTSYIRRRFHGEDLSRIPNFARLAIRPDLVGIVAHGSGQLGWVIGECKSDKLVNSRDLVVAKNYAEVASAYEGYLFFYGRLTSEAITKIKNGEHMFKGSNEYGDRVNKRLLLMEYLVKGDRFRRYALR